MATLTVKSNPAESTATIDGMVARTGVTDANWATIRNGAGNFVRKAGFGADKYEYAWYYVGKSGGVNWDSISRFIATFDTSALGAGATIISAKLFIYGQAKLNGAGDAGDTNIYGATPATDDDLVNGDYGQCGETALCDTPISYAGFSVSGYNEFILNAAGLALINKTGKTRLSIREATHDVANSAPNNVTSETSITIYSADSSVNQPYLEIVYTPGTPSVHTPSWHRFNTFRIP